MEGGQPLPLYRADLLQTAAAAPGALAVLPPGEKRTQKIAVGDADGVLTVFSVKRGAVALAHKGLRGPAPVAAVTMGRGSKQRDQVFSAAGNTVRGVTRKGREFFRFAAPLAEPVRSLVVDGRALFAIGDFTAALYDGSGGNGSGGGNGGFAPAYLAPDRILAAEALSPLGAAAGFDNGSGSTPALVLGCRDSTIRVLAAPSSGSGSGSAAAAKDGWATLFEIPTPSPPTALLAPRDPRLAAGNAAGGGSAQQQQQQQQRAGAGAPPRQALLYGTADGRVVQLVVGQASVMQGFTISGPGGSSGGAPAAAAVRALHCGENYSQALDRGQAGGVDIVIGREDGRVEVWTVGGSAPTAAGGAEWGFGGSSGGSSNGNSSSGSGVPRLVFAAQLSESVCSVGGGYFTTAAAPEIVAHTFSGRVVVLSPSPAALALGAEAAAGGPPVAAGDDAAADRRLAAALHARVAREAAEVEELRQRVERARAKGRQPLSAGEVSAGSSALALSHSLTLVAGGGGGAGPALSQLPYYALVVEASGPLSAVGLAATADLELLDGDEGSGGVAASAAAGAAIASRAPPVVDGDSGNGGGGGGGWRTLVAYRCRESTSRLRIAFRPKEALEPVELRVFAAPARAPKAAAVIECRLPPLCLHERISTDVVALAAAAATAAAGHGHASGAAGSNGAPPPFSELRLSGAFSLAQVHGWAAACLPDLSPRPPTVGADSGDVRYSFRGAALGSLLGCSLSAGAARFVSDSVSALALLHDCLMRRAASDKARAAGSFTLHPSALAHGVALVWPGLVAHTRAARRARLLRALRELRAGGDCDGVEMAPEYEAALRDDDVAGGSAKDVNSSSDGGGGNADSSSAAAAAAKGSGGGASTEQTLAAAAAALAAAEDALARLARDYGRLGGGSIGGGGSAALAARLPGLRALLQRAGEPGAGLDDVVRYLAGGSGGLAV